MTKYTKRSLAAFIILALVVVPFLGLQAQQKMNSDKPCPHEGEDMPPPPMGGEHGNLGKLILDPNVQKELGLKADTVAKIEKKMSEIITADLPFNRGQHNIDEIRYEWFGDGDVAFEAFRAGVVSSNREGNLSKWKTAYDFPAVQSGDVVLSEIPHQRPSGIMGYVMNTRRAPFDDWRVRDALIHAFNFEFINNALNSGYLRSLLAPGYGSLCPRRGLRCADERVPGPVSGFELRVRHPCGSGAPPCVA